MRSRSAPAGSGRRRSATSRGRSQPKDTDELAGRELETVSYLGDGGGVDSSTISSYWISNATATRPRAGLPDLTSNWIATAELYTRQAMTSGATTTWRVMQTDTTYDTNVGDATIGLTRAPRPSATTRPAT